MGNRPRKAAKGRRKVASGRKRAARSDASAADVSAPAPAADPYAAVAMNPNFKQIKRLVGPVVRSSRGRRAMLVWMEEQDDGEIEVMTLTPNTPLECWEADELYRVSEWRSWRTPGDLRALVKTGGPGPWLVRLNVQEIHTLLTPESAARLLDGDDPPADWHEEDDAFTDDPAEAARLDAGQVLRVVPKAMAAYDAEEVAYFEPVRPEQALLDLRLLQLKPTTWGPRVYEPYDLDDLARVFDVPAPLERSPRHPFVRVPDAFVALVDYGRGPGTAAFVWPSTFQWLSDCPDVGRPGHDRSCDCFPAEMRRRRGTVVCHVFARQGGEGPYTYLGLGHLDYPPSAGVAGFRLDPKLDDKVRQRITAGGEIGRRRCGG